ncbi:tetratricopeptide repeat protein [Planctomycetota bacterium]
MAKQPIFGKEPEKIFRLLSIGEDEQDLSEVQGDVVDSSVISDSITSKGQVIERLQTRIDGYRIIKVLGEGGMGIVYLAEQQYPVQRPVALKIIKPGMDSKRVMARFEAEQQALARLDHPNIAHVYGGGTTELDRPYFVMEYIEGIPITDYCDHHKLTIEDRLGLFLQICQAVHHAHQKGIIHRDIKPSNILVSVEHDRAIPKIIDFGVAKATSKPLTERTLATEDTQLLGTPEYMSPEQADMASEDIDTRSDVYSLGVLLYVLMTGVLPFDSETLREGGIDQIRRTIREIDPKTPSTRLTKLGDEAKRVAEKRGTEVGTLARRLHKELEWIPLKAMRKDRSERYRSASELADDIENYLIGAPLIAGPPSTIYRVKKFIQRHKTLVTGIAAVLIVLLAGIYVSTIFAMGQARARSEANKQQQIAEVERDKAQSQAQRSDAIVNFLTNDVLGSAKQVMGRDATAIDLLDAAAAKLDEGVFKDQPLTELLVRYRLGMLIKALSYSRKQIPHMERVREIYMEHGVAPPTMSPQGIMTQLGLAYLRSGYPDKAEPLFQQIVQEREEADEIHTSGYLWMKGRLAEAYYMQARYEEAERIHLEMMHPQFRNGQGISYNRMMGCTYGLAKIYQAQGRYQEAEQMLAKLKDYDRSLVLVPLLARVYLDLGRYKEAESLFEEAIERIPREFPGKDHVDMLAAMSGLAVVRTKQGRTSEAERLFEKALEGRREMKGDDHPETLETVNDFGVLRREQENYEEAESLLRQALAGRQRKLSPDHPACFESMHELAILYKEQARYEEAEKYLLEAVEGRRLKLGDSHPHTLDSINTLIELYKAWNQPEKTEEWRAKMPKTEAVT